MAIIGSFGTRRGYAQGGEKGCHGTTKPKNKTSRNYVKSAATPGRLSIKPKRAPRVYRRRRKNNAKRGVLPDTYRQLNTSHTWMFRVKKRRPPNVVFHNTRGPNRAGWKKKSQKVGKRAKHQRRNRKGKS